MALITGEMWEVETNILSGYNFARNTLSPTGLSVPLTFTRSTTGQRIKSDGLLENIGINLPRFQHHPLTGVPRGILVEAAATNTLLWSEALDNAAWDAPSTNGVVTPNVGTDQFGLITFDRLASDGTNNRRKQPVAHTSGSAIWYNRIAIRKQTPAVTAELSIGLAGGTAVTTTVRLNTETGVATRTVGTGDFGVIEHRNHWILWAAVTDNASGNTSRFSEIRTVTSGATVDFGAAQLEQYSLTSYIKTEGAAAQRASDGLKGPLAIKGERMSMVFDVYTPEHTQQYAQRVIHAYSSSSNRISIYRLSGTIRSEIISNNVSVGTTGSSLASGVRAKIALAIEPLRFAFAVTGSSSVYTVTGSAVPPMSTLEIGSDEIYLNHWNGEILGVDEYNGVAFTDAELLAAVAL